MVHSWKEVMIHELPSMQVTKMPTVNADSRRSRLTGVQGLSLVSRLLRLWS